MTHIFTPDLEVDYTGVNPDNKIREEPHKLKDTITVNAIVPRKGLYYGESIEVRAGADLLLPNIDYQPGELHPDLTIKTGKAVFAGILLFVRDRTVHDVTITYQAVGGEYMTDNSAIANLFETSYLDDRLVDWDNIVNKPWQFPPTAHTHNLTDLKGFEPIIYQLERMLTVQTQGHLQIATAMFRNSLNNFRCGELPHLLPSDKVVQVHDLMYFLTKRKEISDTWIDIKGCHFTYGENNQFEIDTSEYPVGHLFEWSFYKQDNVEIELGVKLKGIVEGNGGIVTVTVFVPNRESFNYEALYLGVKTDPTMKEFSATTRPIPFLSRDGTPSPYAYLATTDDNRNSSTPYPISHEGIDALEEGYLSDHATLYNLN